MNLKKELLLEYDRYCNEKIDEYILEQLSIYLQSEGIELAEDVLQEGKLLNKIRWKLAKFSLRFLKENTINDFLSTYYADKNGNPTEKSRDWIKKKKKEKVKKLRELADNLNPEEKEKVVSSEAAKQMERSAIKSGIFAGIAGIGAGIAYDASIQTHNAQSHVDSAYKGRTRSFDGKAEYPDEDTWVGFDGSEKMYSDNRNGEGIQMSTYPDGTGGTLVDGKLTEKSYNVITSAITVLASLIFGVMWSSLIIAGVQGVRAGIFAHKASVLRREEILQQLKSKKDLKEEFISHYIKKHIIYEGTIDSNYDDKDLEGEGIHARLARQKIVHGKVLPKMKKDVEAMRRIDPDAAAALAKSHNDHLKQGISRAIKGEPDAFTIAMRNKK